MTLQIGTAAPNFSLLGDNGQTFTLSDFRGKNVVLYFYPKDDTSGCTAQACDFRDNLSCFDKENTIILGISRDSVKSHIKFRDKYSLPFPLLADEETIVCQQYGVWVEKSMYGKKYFGIERTTFLIDSNGIIRYIWPKVKVPNHVAEVLEKVKAI